MLGGIVGCEFFSHLAVGHLMIDRGRWPVACHPWMRVAQLLSPPKCSRSTSRVAQLLAPPSLTRTRPLRNASTVCITPRSSAKPLRRPMNE